MRSSVQFLDDSLLTSYSLLSPNKQVTGEEPAAKDTGVQRDLARSAARPCPQNELTRFFAPPSAAATTAESSSEISDASRLTMVTGGLLVPMRSKAKKQG